MQKELRWARLGLAAVFSISAGIAFIGQVETQAASGTNAGSEHERLIDGASDALPKTTFDGRRIHIQSTPDPDWKYCSNDV